MKKILICLLILSCTAVLAEQLTPLKNCPYPQEFFDVVLCKYHDNEDAEKINNSLALKYHNANRVIVYPDSHVPVLVSKRDLEKIRSQFNVLQLSPEMK